MKNKIIKSSNRGLTFSFKHNNFKIGSHYNYVVVPKANKIFIIPTKKGLKISKKKVNIKNNSLIDLRNKKIEKITKKADKLAINFRNNSIIVTAFNIDKPYLTTLIKNDKKKSLKDNIIKVISLFSGCGMLDYPFHLDKNFEIVFACDIMESACQSYRENIGNHIINKSVREIVKEELPDTDVLIGGVSCKPFSNTNRIKRLEDHEDSDLVLDYIRLVKESNCTVFAMENVPQILTASNSMYFNAIKECLSEYKIKAKVLKDCDYGGFTKRKRAFIIGSKIGEPIFLKNEIEQYNTVRQALNNVTEDFYNYNDITTPKQSTIEKIVHIPQGGNFMNIPENLRGKGVHSNSYRRLSLDEPSCTLTNFRKSQILHPICNRIISVAEALAISGFDKNFKVLGPLSDRQQQVGNGVPYNLGNTIKNMIKKLFINNNLLYI